MRAIFLDTRVPLKGYELNEVAAVVDSIESVESDQEVKITGVVGVTSEGNAFEVVADGIKGSLFDMLRINEVHFPSRAHPTS